MTDEGATLPVDIYFMGEWWDEHYQKYHGYPAGIDWDWLDATYLGRQRFLYEHFGQFGLGQERPTLNIPPAEPGQLHPALDYPHVTAVLPFYFFVVPMALGMHLRIQDVGGYTWDTLTAEEVRRIQPVDIAQTPIGAAIVRERERKLARYGVATQMIDLEGPANNAFIMRGPAFYVDLMEDQGLARHYLEVITETTCNTYRFVNQLFGPLDGFFLGNCSVRMISPRMYARMIREYDIRCIEYAAEVTGRPPLCDLHHCDSDVTRYVEAYSAIPGVRMLQASYLSDLQQIKRLMPQTRFSAMVNPAGLLSRPVAQVDADLERNLRDGVHDVWLPNVDPGYGPDQVAALLGRLQQMAARYGRQATFTATTFTCEELDFQFARYRGYEEVSLEGLLAGKG